MAKFSLRDAKANLSRRIALAMEGAEVIITRYFVRAIRLEPVAPKAKRCFGAFKDKIAISAAFEDPSPEDELNGWNL